MSFRSPPPAPETTSSGSAPKLPGTRRKKREKGMASLVWPFLREQIGWVILWVPFTIIGAALAAQALGALQSVIDRAVIQREIPIDRAISRLVVITVLASVVGVPGKLIVGRILYHMEYRLKVWLYERLQGIDPRKLDSVASGQLVTRAVADLQLFELFILIIPIFVALVPILVAALFILFSRHAGMAVLTLLSIPTNLLIAKKMAKTLWGGSWLHLNRAAQVTSTVDEAVRGIRTVKAFGREDVERQKLAKAAQDTYGIVMWRTKYLARYDVLLKIVPDVLNVAVLLIAARLIVNGGFTVGQLLVFITVSLRLSRGVQGFDQAVNFYQYAKTAAGRTYELVFGGREVERGGAPVPDPSDGLFMENVTARYNGRTVLSDFTLDLAPGEFVVVQGGPGSGKSTVAGLANGTVAASSGEVVLEDWDVQKLHPAKLRREVRVLGEEPFLFGRTLRENLLLGAERASSVTEAPKVDDAALRAALYAANAEEIVDELENGLDTVIGDRGLTLSGGQRQRIGLARALVHPPRILVLDDALLAVNPSMEIEILKRVRRHAPETSLLVLTRRAGIETIADRAVRLSGELEQGAELVAEEGGTLRAETPYSLALASIVDGMAPEQRMREKPHVSDKAATDSDHAPTVRNLLAPIAALFGFTSLLVLTFAVLLVVPNILFREVVDAIDAENLSRVDRAVMWIAGVAIVYGGIAFVVRIFKQRVQESLNYLLRRRLFQRLTRLGIDYYDRELPGQVATRVVFDVRKVEEFVEDGPYRFVNTTLVIALALAVVFAWNPGVAFVALLFVPLFVLASGINFPIAARINDWTRREYGRTIERLQEDFVGRYAIHTYGTQAWARAAFDNQAREVRRSRRAAVGVGSVYTEAIDLLLGLAGIAILNRAGHLVIDGTISTGTLSAMHRYVELIFVPIPLMARSFQEYLVARASFRKLREPFNTPILPVERPNARECPDLDGAIALRDVSFTYPGTPRRVLDGVSLQIGPGEVLALVGPTGAGKSSIAKLVQRMYDPDSGSVTVDGTDLRDITSASYTQHLGVVPQEVFCFRGTVLSNLTYGLPAAGVPEVEEAARELGVLQALRSIPGGWSGYVAEEGRNVTAAQRQMIGLVRAWLTDPDLLILDEATATLSEELEREVLRAVSASRRTALFITHRLAVARSADRVAVVDEGRIVESGSHAVLVRRGGAYARLWAFGPEVSERSMAAATGRKPRKEAAPKAKPRAAAAAAGKAPVRRRAAAAKQPRDGAKAGATGGAKTTTTKRVTTRKSPDGKLAATAGTKPPPARSR